MRSMILVILMILLLVLALPIATNGADNTNVPIASTTKARAATVPVKEPTAAPSAEGTESTAPSIPDEEDGGFTPITDIQGSQTPTTATTEITKITTKDEVGNTETITTTTVKDSEGNIEMTEKDVEVEKSSSFVRSLIFIFIATAIGLFFCRARILKYFEKKNPYGSYSQLPLSER